MKKKDYIVHGIWFDPKLFNETIQKSPNYKAMVSKLASYFT